VIIKRIHNNDPEYPKSLQRFLADDAPESAATLGNFQLLGHPKLAIFCSGSCPPTIVSETEQVMEKIIAAGVAVIGGFHSDVEKRCLEILLRGDQPIILSPARSLDKLRIRPSYKEPLKDGRLLFLSFFRSHRHRSDTEMAFKRNLYVAALADKILIIHAARSSKTEELCRELISWGKTVCVLDHQANHNIIGSGGQTISANTVKGLTDALADGVDNHQNGET
jgi:predicted Rossmann fold nucleotide-binding protein DprA/Smf involved in DNA uptake